MADDRTGPEQLNPERLNPEQLDPEQPSKLPRGNGSGEGDVPS